MANHPTAEVVDRQAETVESTDESNTVPRDAATVASPHLLILYYLPETAPSLVNKFPTERIRKAANQTVKMGRGENVDVLLNAEYMPRMFVELWCTLNQEQDPVWYICNLSEKKGVRMNTNGKKTTLKHPNKKVIEDGCELKLESLKFQVTTVAGDVGKTEFELEIRPLSCSLDRQNSSSTDSSSSITSAADLTSLKVPVHQAENKHFGLPFPGHCLPGEAAVLPAASSVSSGSQALCQQQHCPQNVYQYQHSPSVCRYQHPQRVCQHQHPQGGCQYQHPQEGCQYYSSSACCHSSQQHCLQLTPPAHSSYTNCTCAGQGHPLYHSHYGSGSPPLLGTFAVQLSHSTGSGLSHQPSIRPAASRESFEPAINSQFSHSSHPAALNHASEYQYLQHSRLIPNGAGLQVGQAIHSYQAAAVVTQPESAAFYSPPNQVLQPIISNPTTQDRSPQLYYVPASGLPTAPPVNQLDDLRYDCPVQVSSLHPTESTTLSSEQLIGSISQVSLLEQSQTGADIRGQAVAAGTPNNIGQVGGAGVYQSTERIGATGNIAVSTTSFPVGWVPTTHIQQSLGEIRSSEYSSLNNISSNGNRVTLRDHDFIITNFLPSADFSSLDSVRDLHVLISRQQAQENDDRLPQEHADE